MSDAALLIVSTALSLVGSGYTMVLDGTDADLLVIPVARGTPLMKLFTLYPRTSNRSQNV